MLASCTTLFVLFASSSCQDVGSDRIDALEREIRSMHSTMKAVMLENQQLKSLIDMLVDDSAEIHQNMERTNADRCCQMLTDESRKLNKRVDVIEKKQGKLLS